MLEGRHTPEVGIVNLTKVYCPGCGSSLLGGESVGETLTVLHTVCEKNMPVEDGMRKVFDFKVFWKVIVMLLNSSK